MATVVAHTALLSAPLAAACRPKSLASRSSSVQGSGLRMGGAGLTRQRRAVVKVAAAVTPEDLDKKLEELIQEAKELCESGASGECAALWDNIEEISAEAAHKKVREKDTLDPLEKFCNDNPETDECRTYED